LLKVVLNSSIANNLTVQFAVTLLLGTRGSFMHDINLYSLWTRCQWACRHCIV